jgi:biopolymer transport protein ExbB/TolQ
MSRSKDFNAPSTVVLSWARQDIEQRLLFHGARFTQVNYLLSCLVAIVLTVLFYLLLLPFPGSMMYIKFMGQGRAVDIVIPFATVFLAWWCLAILFLKSRKLAFQRKTLELEITPENPEFVLSSATVDQILDRMYQLVDDPRQFVLFNRIEIALSNLRNLGRITEVDEILRTQNENDESFLDATYIVLGGFMWAIPILGFIGTVLGLSIAIGNFSVVLQKNQAEGGGLIESLKGVVGGLGTAFDTTLIALVAALFIQMWITFLRKSEQEFLDSCSEYCLRKIVNRLRIMPYQSETE